MGNNQKPLVGVNAKPAYVVPNNQPVTVNNNGSNNELNVNSSSASGEVGLNDLSALSQGTGEVILGELRRVNSNLIALMILLSGGEDK